MPTAPGEQFEIRQTSTSEDYTPDPSKSLPLSPARQALVDDIIALMMQTPDVRTELLATPMPKLVAVGEHDLGPRELHERFAREIGARFAVYPTGHSPCETAPHQLVRDMTALFDETGVTP